MSDHRSSDLMNSIIGHLFLENKVFQSLDFNEQQSIVLNIIERGAYRADVNHAEILSNECFFQDKETKERRTLSTIFKICSYCRAVGDNVKDYEEDYNVQGYCPSCMDLLFER